MTFAIMSGCVAIIIILVNYLLMQEEEHFAELFEEVSFDGMMPIKAIPDMITDGITNYITIGSFDEWCETHEVSGYWSNHRETDSDYGTFVPTGTPGMSQFVMWEDVWQPKTMITEDPQTWPDYDPAIEAEVTADPDTWKYLSPTAEEEGAGPIEWVDKQGCHNLIRDEHWLIMTMPVGEGQIWVGAAYQEDHMYGKEWLAPDWSCGSDWHNTIAEATVVCLNRVWCNNGIERAEELTHVLISLGMMPATVKMESTIAVVDGEWYFASCDPDNTERAGIRRSNEVSEYHSINEFSFSAEGRCVADEIVEAAIEEAEEFSRGYDAWEASWIDGPQSW